MKNCLNLLVSFCFACGVLYSLPAQAEDKPKAMSDKQAEALLAAVVKIKMKALSDARSNATLGPSREGSGVIIDDRGHILTIGYLVIEADDIEVTTAEGKTSPATLVGYDHATGFGLL